MRVLLSAILAGSLGSAGNEEARRKFLIGWSLAEAGNWSAAKTELQKAYDLAKDPHILVHLGRAQEETGDFIGASRSYRAYLEKLPEAVDRKNVEERIARLAKRVVAAPREVVVDMEAPGASNAEQDARRAKWRAAGWWSVAVSMAFFAGALATAVLVEARESEIERLVHYVDEQGRPIVYDHGVADDFSHLRRDGKLYENLSLGFTLSGVGALAAACTFFVVGR